jgi:hypothetical protein
MVFSDVKVRWIQIQYGTLQSIRHFYSIWIRTVHSQQDKNEVPVIPQFVEGYRKRFTVIKNSASLTHFYTIIPYLYNKILCS